MSGLVFFEDVVIGGTVLGADSTCDPDEVSAILGTDFAENRRSRQMWRDYGLVEFFWERRPGGSPWEGTHFTVQVHRLASAGTDVANDNLARRYGAFERRLPFQELRTAVERRGFQLVELPGASPGCVEYWQPDSQASVLVNADADADDSGEVVSISVPLAADMVAARRNRHNATALSQAPEHLQASEQDRVT